MSPTTVSSYRDDLKKFIEFAENRRGKGLLTGDITSEMIQEFLDFLANNGYRRRNAASSKAKRLVTIRSWFRYLNHEGHVGRDPTAGLSSTRRKYLRCSVADHG